MTRKKAIPSIHVPIMTSNGSMELAWYLYLQYLAEGGGATTVSVEVNSTETGAPGTDAEVTNVGDEVNVKLDFKIPRGQQGPQGQQGDAATVSVGTTTTLPAGSQATVTNVGTPSAAVFNFGIPKGDPGQNPNVDDVQVNNVSVVTNKIAKIDLTGYQPLITGAATTITSNDLTASMALISNASGKVGVSTTTTTELGYIHGVTSSVQTQLNNRITYNSVIQNMNAFNNKGKLFLSTTDNCFYSLNRRFTVSGTGFVSFNAGVLFDGTYESYSSNNIDVNGTGVITITGTAITGTYREGYILISFYSGRGPKNASDVTVQIENAAGNVATIVPTAYSSNGLVLIAEVPTLPTANAISKITFTIVNNRASGTVNPVELEYFCKRPSSISLLPVVTKTGNNTIYGNLTADSFIKSGGTSSQFLKANGSVDSTAYAPISSIPTVGNGTITITQGGTTMGSFTTNQSGDQTIALDSGGYHPDLFDVKWSDHICNDVQWLRADTFSWQSGAVYQVAYQHLADDIDGKTLQSETVAGTTIQFYLADDGHKICPASEESNVIAIYNATGVAWYYIIDTTNQRFKLPRTKFGFTGIRSGVGGFVEAGLPNITAKVQFTGDTNAVAGGGAAYATADSRYHDIGAGGGVYSASSVLIDASEQNAIYGNSDTVQPKATEMYLYFYVGNFTQTALENTAGVTTEVLNDKLDLDLGNATSVTKSAIVGLLTPDYENAVQYTNNAPASYTTTEPCWICCKGASLAYNMTIGNTTIAEFLFSANYTSSWVFCPAGCTLTRIASSQYNNFIVVPLKG